MEARSAITINKPQDEVEAAWRAAEPPFTSVRFQPAPGDQGTEIHVEVEYTVPGGVVGATVAKVVGQQPGQQVADYLRRFKQIIETGEVVRSDGSPDGSRNRNQLHQEDAQPAGASA